MRRFLLAFSMLICSIFVLEAQIIISNDTKFSISRQSPLIAELIDLFSIKPSQIMNISPNPIKEGNEAEINIIDPNSKWTFSKSHIQSKSQNSPILGMKLQGEIKMTINKGYILNKK